MSVTVPYKAKVTGTNASPSVGTITPPTPGNTLLVAVVIPTANAPLVSLTDPLNGAWGTPDLTQALSQGGLTCYFFRKSNIPNAPTSLSATGTTGPFAATFLVAETASMENTSPVAGPIANAALDGGLSLTTHAATFTTLNPNDFVFLVSNNSNLRNLDPTLTTDMTVLQPEMVTSQVHGSYLADAGAAGAKSKNLVFSGSCVAYAVGVIYKAAKPIVTTTGNTVTEGTALRFSLSMASNPGAATDYSAAWGGTAVAVTDYDSNLANATFSAGLSIVGGGIRFANGTTSGTIDVTTYDNALDQDDRTLILTVGGTASTGGTITDDDATPAVSVSDATENAGEVIFTVSLSAASGKSITVDYATADGTSTAGVDYTAKTGTLTFAAGETTKTVTVTVP